MPDICDESYARYSVSLHMSILEIRQKHERLQTSHPEFNGICQMCGNPIPAARLAAVPGTKYCVKCKEIIDQEEKQRKIAYVKSQERTLW